MRDLLTLYALRLAAWLATDHLTDEAIGEAIDWQESRIVMNRFRSGYRRAARKTHHEEEG